jgi:RNA polymerase sigma factor (sigma-70 family)
MHDLMEDYLEAWSVLRGRLRRISKRREFLFSNRTDYENWLSSVTNHGLADALANRDKWDRSKPFHQFAFLRARTLVRKELSCESRYFNIKGLLAREQPVEYRTDDDLATLVARADLDGALDHLSDDQVEALSLRYEADMSVTAIARLMERQPSAVSALLYRGRQRLQELLQGGATGAKEPRSAPPAAKPPTARARSQLDDEERPPPQFSNNVIVLRYLGGQSEKDQRRSGGAGPG